METTLSLSYTSSPKSFNFKIILIIIVVFAIAIQLTLHAVARHPDEVDAVDQACGRNTLQWRIVADKYYQICDMGDGSFGIRVLIKDTQNTFRRITSFVRKTHGKVVTDFNAVVEYVGGEVYIP